MTLIRRIQERRAARAALDARMAEAERIMDADGFVQVGDDRG